MSKRIARNQTITNAVDFFTAKGISIHSVLTMPNLQQLVGVSHLREPDYASMVTSAKKLVQTFEGKALSEEKNNAIQRGHLIAVRYDAKAVAIIITDEPVEKTLFAETDLDLIFVPLHTTASEVEVTEKEEQLAVVA